MEDLVDRNADEDGKKALSHKHNNKAAGYDGIPCEIINSGGMTAITLLTISNAAWEAGKILENWSKAVIRPVFKKGDRVECSIYRVITI